MLTFLIMDKILINKEKIEELLSRGVENIFIKENLKKKLLSGQKLRIYLGIDPTGPTLHMGHVIPLKKLREFQELGHEVILLMGDFTAMIGDPTDKMAVRKQLTHKEVLNNLKKYKKQASLFIDFDGPNKARFEFNSKWLSKMSFVDVLKLASKMTVDQMEKREMFKQRNKEGKPVFIHEFMYPLMQGYDSVAMDVDVEIGGNDQTFNMLVGRHLMSQIKGKEKSVIAMKLMEDDSGKKMGKTEGNMISFVDTPGEMFGKIMSWPDSLIIKGFELCTDVKDFIKFEKEEPRKAKITLAYEVVKIFYNKKTAIKAQEEWEKTFSKKEIPQKIETIGCSKGEELINVLIKNKIVSSKSEFRRLIDGGAITKLDDNKKINKHNETATNGVYKIGKKRFLKIKIS
jgi:tyrosyl-tRNA synthetase